MEHVELSALADLSLAISNLRMLAEGLVASPEQIRAAEALLFVTRGLERVREDLRPLVVAELRRRDGRAPAAVVSLREASADA
jgi:hypothetical protein